MKLNHLNRSPKFAACNCFSKSACEIGNSRNIAMQNCAAFAASSCIPATIVGHSEILTQLRRSVGIQTISRATEARWPSGSHLNLSDSFHSVSTDKRLDIKSTTVLATSTASAGSCAAAQSESAFWVAPTSNLNPNNSIFTISSTTSRSRRSSSCLHALSLRERQSAIQTAPIVPAAAAACVNNPPHCIRNSHQVGPGMSAINTRAISITPPKLWMPANRIPAPEGKK